MADAGAAHEAPDTPAPSTKRKAMEVVQGELAVVADLVPASAQTEHEKELRTAYASCFKATTKVAALEKELAAAKQVRITALCPDVLELVGAHVCIKRRMEYAWEFVKLRELQQLSDGAFADFLCGSPDGLLSPVSIQDLVVLARGPEHEAQKLQGKWLLRPRLCLQSVSNPIGMTDVITLFGWSTRLTRADLRGMFLKQTEGDDRQPPWHLFTSQNLKAMTGDDRLGPVPGLW